jgi:hypothetical protein
MDRFAALLAELAREERERAGGLVVGLERRVQVDARSRGARAAPT